MKSHPNYGMVLICASIIGLVGLQSCTKMIQPEQMTEIRDLREKEARLMRLIKEKEIQVKKMDSEVASREQEVKRCNETAASVRERLNGHPGNLGEPLPEAPPAPTTTTTTKKKSK